jgi:hypothetical protein
VNARVAGGRLGGGSAPETKAGGRRQSAPTGGANLARFARFTGCGLRGCASRHAMNRFRCGGDGFGIRFRPVKIGVEPLKKLFDLMAFEGQFLCGIGLRIDLLIGLLIRPGIGEFRIVCSHNNLIADIVGEFAR